MEDKLTTVVPATYCDVAVTVNGEIPPRARPFFGIQQQSCRGLGRRIAYGVSAYGCITTGCEPYCSNAVFVPGPAVPERWLDSGDGWATQHFYDIEPFDRLTYTAGRHQCRYCSFIAECDNYAQWPPLGGANFKMVHHLETVHAIRAPAQQARQWSAGLFDCCDLRLLCEVLCCFPCQLSRQCMAIRGYADECRIGDAVCVACCYFSVFTPVILTQFRQVVADLSDVEEHCCASCCIVTCCPVCSLIQTHRELASAGVWPGGVCVAPPQQGYTTIV